MELGLFFLIGYLVLVAIIGWVLVELRAIKNQLSYANWLARQRLIKYDHPGTEVEQPPVD